MDNGIFIVVRILSVQLDDAVLKEDLKSEMGEESAIKLIYNWRDKMNM